MSSGLGKLDMHITEKAAALCATCLGTDCTVLDSAFRRIDGPPDRQDRRRSSICESVKAVPAGAAQCASAQKKGARRAVQMAAPYFYACHAQLIEGIVPVQRDGTVLAYVVIGPILLAPADALLRAKIARRLFSFGVSEHTIEKQIELVPVVEAERVKIALKLLSQLVSVRLAELGIEQQAADTAEDTVGTPARLSASERSTRHSKAVRDNPPTSRFILARTRLGNLAEMRRDLGELILRKAGPHSSADATRAAALETVSALWRTALERDGSCMRIDSRKLAVSGLFDAQDSDAVLDWATAAVRRIGRSSASVSRETRATLRKVQSYMRHSPEKRLSRSNVANKAAGMSAAELEGLLRRHLGIGFRLFLTMERLTLARKLLRESRLTATEIAARTGFGDQSNFTKTFIKFEGVTPIQYRMDHLQGTDPLGP